MTLIIKKQNGKEPTKTEAIQAINTVLPMLESSLENQEYQIGNVIYERATDTATHITILD